MNFPCFHLVENLQLFGWKILIIRPLFFNLLLESILEWSLHLSAEYSAGSTGITPVKFYSRIFKPWALWRNFWHEIGAGIVQDELSIGTRGKRFCKAKSDNKYQLQFLCKFARNQFSHFIPVSLKLGLYIQKMYSTNSKYIRGWLDSFGSGIFK